MNPVRILIVEDEVLIADMLERYLLKKGHQVVGSAISYEEAIALYLQEQPDIVLIDIRLYGKNTGIDFAHFIRQQPVSRPFIYLTSQLDEESLEKAKATFPAGFLSKPIPKESLYTTIEIALYNHKAREQETSTIRLFNGRRYYLVPIDDILYIQAEHIYVRVHLIDKQQLLPRVTLRELLEQLPADQFVQTHRSYAINIYQVERWDTDNFYIQDVAVPVSRSRRRGVLSYLENK